MKLYVILTTVAMLLAWAEAGNILAAKWEQLPGGLTRVSKGNSGVWGVNKHGNIYKQNSNGRDWTQISGGLVQVSSGASVWGVNSNDNIYRYKGNNQWQQIPGGLTNVAVSNQDRVWGVNRGGNIYRRNGNSWQQIAGGAKQVTVGESGVWVVNSRDEIYYRTGTFGDVNTAGSGWQKIPGGLKWISSGEDIVVGVNSNDEIYYRRGVSSDNPTGTGWVKVPGRLMQIDVDGDQVVGVNSGHNIYKSPVTSGCDCNNVNDKEFDVTDVTYDVKHGVINLMPPQNVGKKIIRNRASQSQKTKFSVTRTITETSSFTHKAGASVKVGTSFKTGVPFIAEGKISVEVTASYEFSYGTTKSEAKTVTAEFWCTGAPFMITECDALLFRDRMEVPYTRTWTQKEDSSCLCTDSGTFTKIAGSRLELDTIERGTLKRK